MIEISAAEVFMFGDRPRAETFRLLAESGFSAVELLVPARLDEHADRESVIDLRRSLDRWGLTVSALSGGWPLASPDPETRVGAVRTVAALARIADELGCGQLTSELNGGTTVREKRSREAARRSLDELAAVLDGRSITLAVEPHPGDVIERHDEGVALVRAVGSRHVRYLYCSPHTFVLGEDAAAMIREAADVLQFVHVADSNRQEKIVVGYRVKGYANALTQPEFEGTLSAHEHLMPGRGDIDFDAIGDSLAAIDYDGFISCVTFGIRDAAETVAARRSMERIRDRVSAARPA